MEPTWNTAAAAALLPGQKAWLLQAGAVLETLHAELGVIKACVEAMAGASGSEAGRGNGAGPSSATAAGAGPSGSSVAAAPVLPSAAGDRWTLAQVKKALKSIEAETTRFAFGKQHLK